MLKHVRLRMQYDDMTGVLMQRISRIPLSYRRKAKTPHGRGLRYIQIVAFCRCRVAQLCQSMKGLSNFLAHFQYQKVNIALFANPHESPYEQKGKLLL